MYPPHRMLILTHILQTEVTSKMSALKQRLHKKPSSAFVADLSHVTDLVPMGQINVTGILHHQHHGRTPIM